MRGQEPHEGWLLFGREGPTLQVFETLKSRCANGFAQSCKKSPGKEASWKHDAESAKAGPGGDKGQERIGPWWLGNSNAKGNGSRDLLEPLKLSESSVSVERSHL